MCEENDKLDFYGPVIELMAGPDGFRKDDWLAVGPEGCSIVTTDISQVVAKALSDAIGGGRGLVKLKDRVMSWEPTQSNILDDFRRAYVLMKADEVRKASQPPEPLTLIVSAGWINHPDFAETRRRYEEAGFKVELYENK